MGNFKCFEFTYPGEYTQPEREIYVDCDTTNMTANIYFTPFEGASWAEMGIYTEPKDNGANKDIMIKCLNNVFLPPLENWSQLHDRRPPLEDWGLVFHFPFNYTLLTFYYVFISPLTRMA